jgi:hypothetical protein
MPHGWKGSDMFVDTAIRLIDQIVYKPDWKFEAQDDTGRFEDSICVKITYPAFDSSKESYDEEKGEYTKQIVTYATFRMIVRDCTDVDLYRKIIEVLMEIELHEAREFLRVAPTLWAPFHPHRYDGMKRWGDDMRGDLLFGVV